MNRVILDGGCNRAVCGRVIAEGVVERLRKSGIQLDGKISGEKVDFRLSRNNCLAS